MYVNYNNIIIDQGVNVAHIRDRYDKYLPIKVLDNGKTLLMPLIPKCANSTIANLYYNLNVAKTEIVNENEHYDWNKYYVHNKYVNIYDYENRFCVAVIRDPLARLESAYKTFCEFGNKQYAEKYDEYVINTLKSYNNDKENRNIIDRHVASQFSAYDINKIDVFVHINDLDRFFASYEIEKQNNVNVSKEKFRFALNDRCIILDLLEEDYMIYNNILQSDKIYV